MGIRLLPEEFVDLTVRWECADLEHIGHDHSHKNTILEESDVHGQPDLLSYLLVVVMTKGQQTRPSDMTDFLTALCNSTCNIFAIIMLVQYLGAYFDLGLVYF
jgi:hypothetical protein